MNPLVHAGRIRRSIAALLLLAASISLPVPVLGAVQGSWQEAETTFRAALATRDGTQVLTALEMVKPYDTPDAAKLVLQFAALHEDILVAQEAFRLLSALKAPEAQQIVIDEGANAKKWELRSVCIRAMGSYPGEFVRKRLIDALERETKVWQVRASAVCSLAQLRRKDCVPVLIGRLEKEKVGRVIWDIVRGLKEMTGENLEADAAAWSHWWAVHGDQFRMPPPGESAKRDADRQDLRTAVKAGLYGPIYSEKVAFVFDCSGSMLASTELQGSRFDVARKELIRTLENLSEHTYFNIYAFNDSVYAFDKGLQKAKPSTVEKAIQFVNRLVATGETNAHGGLQAAFKDPDVDTIYFLTDGSPTVGEISIPILIEQQVATWNQNRLVIIHAVGFFPGEAKYEDKEEAHGFLLRLAHRHGGFYKEIY